MPQPLDSFPQSIGGLFEFRKRRGGLGSAGGQVAHRLVDLRRAERLLAHPFARRFESRLQIDHRFDHLAQLAVDVAHVRHAVADFLVEFVHFHDTHCDRRLHMADDVVDIERGDRRLVGEPADFAGDDQEAAAVLARFFRFDRGVDRQQVGLVGDFGDRRHHHVDVVRLFADGGELGGNRRGGAGQPVHGGFHFGQPRAAAIGQRSRVFGAAIHFVHRHRQLLAGGRDFLHGRRDLGRRRPERLHRRLLHFRRRRDLRGGRHQVDTRTLDLAHQIVQPLDHGIDAVRELSDFVLAINRDAGRQVAGALGHFPHAVDQQPSRSNDARGDPRAERENEHQIASAQDQHESGPPADRVDRRLFIGPREPLGLDAQLIDRLLIGDVQLLQLRPLEVEGVAAAHRIFIGRAVRLQQRAERPFRQFVELVGRLYDGRIKLPIEFAAERFRFPIIEPSLEFLAAFLETLAARRPAFGRGILGDFVQQQGGFQQTERRRQNVGPQVLHALDLVVERSFHLDFRPHPGTAEGEQQEVGGENSNEGVQFRAETEVAEAHKGWFQKRRGRHAGPCRLHEPTRTSKREVFPARIVRA